MNEVRPNKIEIEFLNLAYNRFYDLFDEVIDDDFWKKDEWDRYSKIQQVFLIYTELLNYEPIRYVIENMKKARPPMEAEIGSELFKFVRNVLSHFPFYNSWDTVWISKPLVNWYKESQTIDKFLVKYEGHAEVKYRFWEGKKKEMTYLSIKFPEKYDENSKIYLKDILSEKDGIKFCFILMNNILSTQVQEMIEKP